MEPRPKHEKYNYKTSGRKYEKIFASLIWPMIPQAGNKMH